MRLNKVSNSESVLQNHFGSDPNDRDGMSVIALSTPAICCGVNGEAFVSCKRRARARTSWIAMCECFAARCWTQCTVGELLLKSAMWAFVRSWQVASMTSQSISRPAISRSEFVIVPVGLLSETMLSEISFGYCIRNTVGVVDLSSPTMTPPRPCPDASVMPT